MRVESLKNHITVVHEGIKEWQCNQCGKSYSQRHYMQVHIKRVHDKDGNGRIDHKCEHCGKSYSSKQYLQIHVSTNHNELPSPNFSNL